MSHALLMLFHSLGKEFKMVISSAEEYIVKHKHTCALTHNATVLGITLLEPLIILFLFKTYSYMLFFFNKLMNILICPRTFLLWIFKK
jgi:hypothetical protein